MRVRQCDTPLPEAAGAPDCRVLCGLGRTRLPRTRELQHMFEPYWRLPRRTRIFVRMQSHAQVARMRARAAAAHARAFSWRAARLGRNAMRSRRAAGYAVSECCRMGKTDSCALGRGRRVPRAWAHAGVQQLGLSGGRQATRSFSARFFYSLAARSSASSGTRRRSGAADVSGVRLAFTAHFLSSPRQIAERHTAALRRCR